MHNYQHDAENRIAKVDAGTGNEASYFYDANNWSVNQGGQTRSFAYDSLGRMTSQTTPEGGAVSSTYKDCGSVH
ncbi:MAG: RHS repeat domain-containing protein [Acidobacteriota bacterium]